MTFKGPRLPVLALTLVVLLATCTKNGATTADTFSTDRLEGYAGFPTPALARSSIGTSTPGEAPRPPQVTKIPLKVMFKSPVGKAPATQWALVAFNQPMISLGVITPAASHTKPLTIAPNADYTWRWVAGDTLRAEFTKTLPNATAFTVTLDTSLISLGGTRLEKPLAWSFETPRPRIMNIYKRDDHSFSLKELYPDNGFILEFDQRVAPAGVQGHVRLTAGGRPVDFTLSSGKYPNQLHLTPANSFPEKAQVTVEVIGGYTGTEGPLPGHNALSRGFRVYGDLTGGITTERPGANKKLNPFHHELLFTFTGAVLESEFLKHLAITPAIKKLKERIRGNSGCSSNSYRFPSVRGKACSYSFGIEGPLAPGTRYTIRVKQGMPGLNGKHLDREHRLTFTTDDYPPGLFLPLDQEGTLPAGKAYPYKHTNIRSLRIAEHPVKVSEIGEFLRCVRRFKEKDYISPYRSDKASTITRPGGRSSHYFSCIKHKPAARRTLGAASPKNRIRSGSLRFTRGARVVAFTSPQIVDGHGRPVIFHRFVHVTDLGVHTRVHPFGIIAWVTNFQTGRPVRGAKIRVFDEKGAALAAGTTGVDGVWEYASKTPLTKERSWSSSLLVVAEKGRDFAFTAGEAARYEGEYPMGESNVVDEDDSLESKYPWLYEDLSMDLDSGSSNWSLTPVTTGYIGLERGVYRPGQTVYIHGAVRLYNLHKSRPDAGARLLIRLTDAYRTILGTLAVTADAMGVFRATFPLPRGAKLGYYRVALLKGGSNLAGTSLQVKMYREPRFEVFFSSKKYDYLPGESATLTVRGKYLFGGRMGKAKYRMNILGRETCRYFSGEFSGFIAGRYANHAGGSRKWYNTTGRLAESGKKHLAIPLDTFSSTPVPFPVSHVAEVEVSSSSQRAVAASTRFVRHPARLYVAFKGMPDKDTRTRRELRILTPFGKPGPKSEVTVRFYEARYRSYRYRRDNLLERMGGGGRTPGYYPVGRPIWTQSITVPPKGFTVSFMWPREGLDRFFRGILVYEVRDKKGNLSRTTDLVYRPSEASAKKPEKEKKPRNYLTVAPDKDDYKVGETAVLTVKTRGIIREAVLFVERERIFHTERLRFNAKGVATVRVKVRPEFIRSVAVRVVGLVDKASLRRKVPYVVAKTDIVMSASANRLVVGISTDKPTYGPREKVRINLDVKDLDGHAHKAHVVIMAVDEAVLRLTRFSMANPFS
ncbi:hypothetical protein KJ865_14135, partial [Myxococcota bacterium]|nr:hypothetical protein [Myxococcota bacterium]